MKKQLKHKQFLQLWYNRCGIKNKAVESHMEEIYNGLLAAKEVAGDEPSVVLIHDGVRPLITEQTISDNIAKVEEGHLWK